MQALGSLPKARKSLPCWACILNRELQKRGSNMNEANKKELDKDSFEFGLFIGNISGAIIVGLGVIAILLLIR